MTSNIGLKNLPKPLVKGKTASDIQDKRTRKRRFLNLSYPQSDPDGIYSNYDKTGNHYSGKGGFIDEYKEHLDRFQKSMSLRSMRDRRRNGAKNNRGPAFIFGKNAANQNEIELRFLEGKNTEYRYIREICNMGYNL